MVVTIPSIASSTAFPSSREKTRGNLCVAGRRGRVIALSVCLRDSACSASRSCPLARGPCTFGTHLRVLQSFLRLRFAARASRRHHRNIDSATLHPDAPSINNYFGQRYAPCPQSLRKAPRRGGRRVGETLASCLRFPCRERRPVAETRGVSLCYYCDNAMI